jgi:hypothetical protein
MSVVNIDPEAFSKAVAAAVTAAIAEAMKVATPPPPAVPPCTICGVSMEQHRGKDNRQLTCVEAFRKAGVAPVQEVKGKTKADRATANERPSMAQVKAEATVHRGERKATARKRPRRLRYFSKLRANANLKALDLAPTQLAVVKRIHKAGKKGALARDVEKVLGHGDPRKGHGPFSSTMGWLRAHTDLIEVAPDAQMSASL